MAQEFTSIPPPEEIRARLRRLGRREWWLWFSATTVTILSTVTFVLLSLPWLFSSNQPFFQLWPQQAVPGLLGLVLLFNAFAVYRQRQFRQQRQQINQAATGTAGLSAEAGQTFELSELDPVTGLCSRRFAAQRLAKEIVRAHREKEPLALLVLDLNDFGQLNQHSGRAFGDLVLSEFARRLKRATRGSDLVIRLGSDEFLLVLPACSLGTVQRVLDRLRPVEISCGSQKVTLTFSASALEREPGELPEDLLKRADQVLQLYKNAGQNVPRTVVSE